MHPSLRFLFFCLSFFILSACSTLKPLDFEDPSVTVNSVRVIPSEGVAPQFEISLHIINPNSISLPLKGVAYSVSVEDKKILTGVSNKLPVIEAYGEGDVTLRASANLLNSIRLITSLMQKNSDKVTYTLDAKLDLGTLIPDIRISEKGEITLTPPR